MRLSFFAKKNSTPLFTNVWIVERMRSKRTKKPSNQTQATFSGMQTKNPQKIIKKLFFASLIKNNLFVIFVLLFLPNVCVVSLSECYMSVLCGSIYAL